MKKKIKRKNGYYKEYEICYIKHPKYNDCHKPLFHVALIEEVIGRALFKNECVHHINNNSLNNFLKNLILMNFSSHRSCHHSIQECVGLLIKKGDMLWQNI